jgi:transcriptional regulator with GAF, ATPase, and Fis domain
LDEYRIQLEIAKSEMAALEAEAVGATEVLTATYDEMNETSWQMADLERRLGFARHCLRLLGEEPDDRRLSGAFVSWLSDDLGVERCSLMTPDDSGEVLRIAAQRGIDDAVTAQVCVRLGQGVAGWVALNRKPLLVRMRSQADVTPAAQSTTYNSESFIAVPVVHNGRLYGVLNLSNKRAGSCSAAWTSIAPRWPGRPWRCGCRVSGLPRRDGPRGLSAVRRVAQFADFD